MKSDLVNCAVCGEQLTEQSRGVATTGEPCHNKCAVYDWIASPFGLIQERIAEARKQNLIDEETEANLERLVRKTEDQIPDYIATGD